MHLTAKELRQKAWESLKGRYWFSVLAALLAAVFGAVIAFEPANMVTVRVNSNAVTQIQNALSDPQLQKAVASVTFSLYSAMFIFILALFIMTIIIRVLGTAIHLGYCRYNIALHESTDEPKVELLFSQFKNLVPALLMHLLMWLKIFLWSLLFIVPGIIAALNYAMAPYILAENPDLSPSEAIDRSKAMMKGEKWNLFVMELSFIGWMILAALIPVFGALLLAPYIESAEAAFYLDRSGRFEPQSENEESVII